MAKLTPMMQQYVDSKEQYPDCLLMFRVGDFFELFYDDAAIAAQELNIALTSRDGKKEGEDKTPMAGVPHHALEAYLGRLIKKGYKVAICDQVEDPKQAKGLVKRQVVRVVTPGTVIEDNLLEPTQNNWLLAITQVEGEWGLAFADISTAQFQCTQFRGSKEQVEAIVSSLNPTEIIATENPRLLYTQAIVSLVSEPLAIEEFYPDLSGHFLAGNKVAARAVSIILTYLQDRHSKVTHMETITWYDPDLFLFLDATSQRNLEILAPLDGNTQGPSLLKVVDKTVTAMGGRMLKNLLITPLTDMEAINQRLENVTFFVDSYLTRKKIRELFKNIYDLERLVSKISYASANARDVLALARSLALVPEIKSLLQNMDADAVQQLEGYQDLCDLVKRAIHPDPPIAVKEGNIIRSGYSAQLDDIRELAVNGSKWIRDYEAELRSSTGIKSLKIGFNKVFGYYIEVTKTHLHLVPEEFQRKQTLVNCERFETDVLKEWEQKILTATERQHSLEYQLFSDIRDEVTKWIPSIQRAARAIAAVDCWQSFATVAEDYNYCRPIVDSSVSLDIREGRHPVVERFGEQEFIANDCQMDIQSQQIMVITGPNMAGKSTYMRQVALISLLAHVGSYVPANYARIGVMDAIFTRIGASDDLASGRSTFMVEMSELARILSRVTENSLVLLDEIGRGTGTADGISIARATLEYLHDNVGMTAKTLFATHYHQLTSLSQSMERLFNCSVHVTEKDGEVTFLHKIIPGGSDRSYGIHVAQLAGLPAALVKQAEVYLQQGWQDEQIIQEVAVSQEQQLQPELRQLVQAISSLDLDGISPRQAWGELERLKKLALEVVTNNDH